MSTTIDSGDARSRAAKSPDAFRTISEVAADLDVPQHVLRFWETKFSQIRPLKRGGGRRYYRPEDVDLLRRIRTLLYGEGYTIKGVQKVLREGGRSAAEPVAAGSAPPVGHEADEPDTDAAEIGADEPADEADEIVEAAPAQPEPLAAEERQRLADLKNELLELKSLLGDALGASR
ncbi:MAG: MerR family transcriptional regulator [Alphaproteobacteria bacterium]|jgi:DNA-binding transcriptional MerR regulator|nr:MerR family transcriptional regulator [Alphaproteobacteria bacterium]